MMIQCMGLMLLRITYYIIYHIIIGWFYLFKVSG